MDIEITDPGIYEGVWLSHDHGGLSGLGTNSVRGQVTRKGFVR